MELSKAPDALLRSSRGPVREHQNDKGRVALDPVPVSKGNFLDDGRLVWLLSEPGADNAARGADEAERLWS